MDSVELTGDVENYARMISSLRIHEPRYCSPHQVPTLRIISSNLLGVVEMAGVAAAAAQNAGPRVVTSPPGWKLIDLSPFAFRVSFYSSCAVTQCCTMLIVPSVISSPTPRSPPMVV